MPAADFVAYLAPLGALFVLAGFLCRSQLWLRISAIAGVFCFVLFYLQATHVPLWTAMAAFGLFVAANFYTLNRIMAEGRMFHLKAEEMMLFARLPGLTPVQFKLLLADAQWHEASEAMLLTTEGTMPERLYFVLEGKAEVRRADTSFDIGPHAFVGELAFLRNQPATATVHAKPGALYVSWLPDKLRALMKTNDGINSAVSSLLSGDLAEKLVRSGLSSRA